MGVVVATGKIDRQLRGRVVFFHLSGRCASLLLSLLHLQVLHNDLLCSSSAHAQNSCKCPALHLHSIFCSIALV